MSKRERERERERDRMSLLFVFHYREGLPKIKAHYGEGSGSIFLGHLKCEGDESNLGECDHMGWGNQNCQHSDDAGVVCCKYAYSASSDSNPSLHIVYTVYTSENIFKSFFVIVHVAHDNVLYMT